MSAPIAFFDSITDAGPADADKIGVSGSHGGMFPAAAASRAGLRAVILNDAGRGLDDAGVAGVAALDEVGMAGAAADGMSCLIGSASDARDAGILSFVNETASAVGLEIGMSVALAAARLAKAAPPPQAILGPVEEARRSARVGGVDVLLVDSASLVRPEDAGAVIVAGSHGALIGGDPARALKACARFAAFNDAGMGKDDCGRSRLPALQSRGVAAVTVFAASARIGDALSGLESGVISAVNEAAAALGARIGEPLRERIESLRA